MYADRMIVIALVGVFISGFVFGAVLGFRRLEDWFDPWLPAAVTDRLDTHLWIDDLDGTGLIGDVPPSWTGDSLR